MISSSELSPFWALAMCGWLTEAKKRFSNLNEAFTSIKFILKDQNFPISGWKRSLLEDIYYGHKAFEASKEGPIRNEHKR